MVTAGLAATAMGCPPEAANDDDVVNDDDVADDDDAMDDDDVLDDDDAAADLDGDGVSIDEGDCDDSDPDNYPGNTEVCDGRDNDCTAGADFPGETTDADGDGARACDDCDDDDPNAVSVCGGELQAGSFQMGCTTAQEPFCTLDEQPVHEVVLTRNFWIATTEVTLGQWEVLIGNDPTDGWGPAQCGLDCPVSYLTWWDALAFTNALSISVGLPACFTLNDCTGAAGENLRCDEVVVESPSGEPADCLGFRLPTEAEWEYAARAGTDLIYSGSNTLSEVGWANEDLNILTGDLEPVAMKAPNAWGLYDLSGNVAEIVWDAFEPGYYSQSPVEDPSGPVELSRVGWLYRGGGWQTDPAGCRVSYRAAAYQQFLLVGFRPARSLPAPPPG